MWSDRAWMLIGTWKAVGSRRYVDLAPKPQGCADGAAATLGSRSKPRMRMAVIRHKLRGELKLCRMLKRCYIPASALPLITVLCLCGAEPGRALLSGWLGTGLFAAGLFLIFMREADACFQLERLARLRQRRIQRCAYPRAAPKFASKFKASSCTRPVSAERTAASITAMTATTSAGATGLGPSVQSAASKPR